MARRSARVIGMLAACLLASACVPADPAATPGEGRLTFQDLRAPGVFDRGGMAVGDSADGAAGFWAAVPGIPRPERALAINLDTGAEVEVALFAAPRSARAIRLSHEAAAALGVADQPARIRIVAVRRKPSIDINQW